MQATSLKPKHVEALVERWKAESLSAGTIKNRMTELRWWAEKIGKQNVIARDNDHYGIPQRQYVTNVSKSRELTAGDLAKVTDPYTRMSLSCRPHSGCGGRSRSRSGPSGPTAATGSRSRTAGPRAAGSARSRSAPSSSARCSTKPSGSPVSGSLIPKTMQLRAAAAALQGAVHGGRHPPCSRPPPPVCAAALPGADRLGMSGAGWADQKAAHVRAASHRSPGSLHHQPRAGSRSRKHRFGLFRSIAVPGGGIEPERLGC